MTNSLKVTLLCIPKISFFLEKSIQNFFNDGSLVIRPLYGIDLDHTYRHLFSTWLNLFDSLLLSLAYYKHSYPAIISLSYLIRHLFASISWLCQNMLTKGLSQHVLLQDFSRSNMLAFGTFQQRDDGALFRVGSLTLFPVNRGRCQPTFKKRIQIEWPSADFPHCTH